MPCSAIATARAQVSQESLARLLTDELVATLVLDFLERKFPQLNPEIIEAWLRHSSIRAPGVTFRLGNYLINVREGKVTVNTVSGRTAQACPERRRRDQQMVDLLTREVTAFLTQAAGALFQQQARAAIATRYSIAEEQRAPNGALVLTVNL